MLATEASWKRQAAVIGDERQALKKGSPATTLFRRQRAVEGNCRRSPRNEGVGGSSPPSASACRATLVVRALRPPAYTTSRFGPRAQIGGASVQRQACQRLSRGYAIRHREFTRRHQRLKRYLRGIVLQARCPAGVPRPWALNAPAWSTSCLRKASAGTPLNATVITIATGHICRRPPRPPAEGCERASRSPSPVRA